MAVNVRLHRHLDFSGEVTAANTTTITVKGTTNHGNGTKIQTIDVPSSTPIKTSAGGTAPALSELIGKHVTVKEKSPGTARVVIVHSSEAKKS